MLGYLQKIWERPLGRVLIVLIGAFLVAATTVRYPPLRNVIRWFLPLGLLVWGGSRIFLYGRHNLLSLIAGCLLILGGITRALFQLAPMDELTGTMANLVPVVGIFVEMFAHHYRERD